MKKQERRITVLILAAVAVLSPAWALPEWSIRAENEPKASPMDLSGVQTYGGAYPEIPPFVTVGPKGPTYYVSTAWTVALRLREGKSILEHSNAFDVEGASLVTQDDVRRGEYPPPENLDPNTYWRRNYWGVFSAHMVDGDGFSEPSIYVICHGENKNEKFGFTPHRYVNSITPSREYDSSEYSGPDEAGVYRDNWKTYFAFISGAWSPLSDKDGGNFQAHDFGPIVWPSMPYLDEQGDFLSGGVRHPSSIIHDGHLYVFYQDCSWGEEPGRLPGIKVARAPLSSGLTPAAFRNYFDGSFAEPSLPTGFDRDKGPDFFKKPGGRSSAILGDENAQRFSVAKLKGTSYFVGVHETHEDGLTRLYLRLSDDLVHWSDRQPIEGSSAPWGAGLHYPIFANQDYTSNTLIEPDRFYVAGAAKGAVVTISLAVSIDDTQTQQEGADCTR